MSGEKFKNTPTVKFVPFSGVLLIKKERGERKGEKRRRKRKRLAQSSDQPSECLVGKLKGRVNSLFDCKELQRINNPITREGRYSSSNLPFV